MNRNLFWSGGRYILCKFDVENESMKRFLPLILFLLSFSALGQDPKLDRLEMYYDQGHYKMVYRKAKRLLNKPFYDYSALPDFYAALSQFQLARDDKKFREAFDEAEANFQRFLDEDVDGKTYTMHIHEVQQLQYDLAQMSLSFKNQNKTSQAAYIDGIIKRLFKDGKTAEEIATTHVNNTPPDNDKTPVKDKEPKENTTSSGTRDDVIKYAEEFMGIPYKYGSQDPKKGFDCSGYTSFVLQKYNYYLSRSSKDQYNNVKKIKRNKVKKGDLVFFGNPGIHHVGLVHEVHKNGEITMIHASSSLGISLVNIDQSTYWSPRIKAFGRVIQD